MLINEKTWRFVREHADDDARKVALQGAKDQEIDLTLALQQIAGRQMACRKLPTWAEVEGIVYPPRLNMEQCSSEQTARYKAMIAGRGERMVDLTGGFGIDFYWMSQGFLHRQYVEQNQALCSIAEANFRLLGLNCSVCCCNTETYLKDMSPVSLAYLDPARRNEHGGRTYSIADCTPNVLELLPLLMSKADRVMLKLSPMLDWRKAVSDLQYPSPNTHHPSPIVSQVHIVSVDNECKELLLLLDKEHTDLRVLCVNLSKDGELVFETTYGGQSPCTGNHISHPLTSSPSHFLYEPNASIMKAGCFTELEKRFAVRQIAPNSHLFISSDEIDDFPGRKFHISSISQMNKQELRTALRDIDHANISVRNFPLSVDQLRKKLKLKDGGDVYIFATTTTDGAHRLFICRKIG